MKFGEQLRSSVIREYQWYYIDYDGLKTDLKHPSGSLAPPAAAAAPGDDTTTRSSKTSRREWTEDDESRFVSKLESELEKVHTKQQVKAMEISRRIAVSEREVRDVVNRLNERGLGEEGPSEEEFMLLEEDLSDIIADVHDLAKFVQLNYTGFYKIIKKHDKMTGWHLKPVFDTRLKAKPFYKENYDASVVKLSKLYDLVRTRGNPVKGDSAAGGSQANFIRHTTKYWVHPDNVTELKLIILKHLPVLVFNASKEFEEQDAAITSIYYDNPEKFDLYEGRLKKTEGAEAIRLRWYGGMQNETIFVERKTHREDWTGEKSVKARFALKEKNVNAYLRGDLLPAAIFEKARKEGKKSEKAIAEDERLASEIQWTVLKKGYKPVCRSFYHRTAFQLPADARVRISLDTELTMIREDNTDGNIRSGDNWRRMDIGIDYPFSQLPPGDIVRFPYAILEVKLQTQLGQEPPEWVRQLIASHLVEAVPKFSKFIHGTACLFPKQIHLLPYWLPQMGVDIRKPVTHDFGIQRAGQSATTNTSDDEDDDYDSDEEPNGSSNGRNGNSGNGESSAQGAARGRQQQILAADEEEQTALGPAANEDTYLYDSDDEEDEDRMAEARRVGGWTYYSTLAQTTANTVGRGALSVLKAIIPRPRATQVPRNQRLEALLGTGELQTQRIRAPPGKKIYVPVRVEPKVYFAAERTFLGWLEYSIYVSTIAVTLLNFGTKQGGMPSFIAATAFTILAILSLLYAVVVYLYRSNAIRTRKAARYYDKLGPSALCAALFVAVALNFAFEGRSHSLPPQESHTITLHAPTWDHAIRFRNKDMALFSKMVSMYPRFGPWNQARQLCGVIHSQLGLAPSQACLPFIHPETVPAAKEYAFSHHRTANEKDGSKLLPGELEFRVVDIAGVRLYVLVFPAKKMSGIVGVWQNHGTGITTRLAQDLLDGIERDSAVFTVNELQFEAAGEDVELEKLPEATYLPEVEAHSQLRERIAGLMKRASIVPEAAEKLRADDVYLYPTGMAAIYYLHKILTREVEQTRKGTVVALGSVFHSSWHVFEEESPNGFKHFGRCETAEELDVIEKWLDQESKEGRSVSYLFVEFPSNPLLVSVDLARLRGWADKYNFPIVVDDTVGSFASIDLLPVADAIVTSLTKSFSGYANVMAGSVILNPSLPFYTTAFKPALKSQHKNELYSGDATKLLVNSADYLSRSAILNRNAQAIADLAFSYSSSSTDTNNKKVLVKTVLYPTYSPTLANYQQYMRQAQASLDEKGEKFHPGHGCLLSIEFIDKPTAIKFYDSLHVHKGPHLGAHLTLAMPYNEMVWGNEEIVREGYHMGYGLHLEQVRVSVGLEDEEELLAVFRAAFEAALEGDLARLRAPTALTVLYPFCL
ncbi:vacuolar transporter chaperone 4 [Naviculisporaceae sp. PSN 640]